MSIHQSESNLPIRVIAVAVVIGFATFMALANRSGDKPSLSGETTSEEVVGGMDHPADLASVRLEKKAGGGWQLLRSGEPYFIKGAGGDKHLEDLVAAGGNSIRTWGIGDDTAALLDRAHELGLSVTLGHWMGHKRHGFDYHDPAQVRKQLDDMLAAVERFKDHPAVLIWGVGNEVELEQDDDPVVWKAINDAAKAIKLIDPNHPTMIVLAELGKDESKVKAVGAYCPDIDIIGINTYDGATSAVARLAKHQFGRPCIVTEYGPPLYQKDSLGSHAEATSTEKGALYARIYREGILSHPDICLGSYSFFWDSKLELTDTYFGQFLITGERLAQVEVFHELFEADSPENRCPVVESLTLSTESRITRPGETFEARLPASDPDGDPLIWQWELKDELNRTVGGDLAEGGPAIPNTVQVGADGRATVTSPGPGSYRLYARVLDGKGNAATASISLKVRN
ncbi:glycoside hydrolase family 2 TIM barrel-domain containing protein [Haloferula sp.]|uniref:glycoside hydrolase family 2 TIM barrel-domain containing protein n=1 Tax=Haloferula sp. TaxID=2497595 RepID=UPI003C71DDB6